jgi:carboxyl-terminal processing protease
MQQILSQHLGQKEITPSVLRDSYRIYFDQFDPNRIYLLASEVDPFLNLKDEEMLKQLGDYRKGNFLVYSQINQVIQKAIRRSRAIRAILEQDPLLLSAEPKTKRLLDSKEEQLLDPNVQAPYSKTLRDLQEKMHDQIVNFIAEKKSLSGSNLVPRLIKAYEQSLRSNESLYLFQNSEGDPFSDEEKEHFLTLHILKSLANSLDPHTSFLGASEAFNMSARLEKKMEGIGVLLREDSKGVVIHELVPNGPAEKSGQVRVNDRIIKIDGKTMAELPVDEVLNLLKGDVGSNVTLELKRIGKEGKEHLITVSLKRESIQLNNDRVEVFSVPYGNGLIGIITLYSFYEGKNDVSAENDIKKAIEQLKSQGKLLGLILDLRDNGGGFLLQAVKVAGLFMKTGVVVVSKYSDGEKHFYRDLDPNAYYEGPMVILVSRATASAAEIVSQALQDYGIALIVGDEHTYGKGTIQSQTVSTGETLSLFKVTVGTYYTASGKSPQLKGVEADIIVPSRLAHEHIGEEYLEHPLSAAPIAPSFDDNLNDISSTVKPWYLHYYMPSIEHKKEVWRKMIPQLKKNSQERLAKNKDYQLFINGETLESGQEAKDPSEDYRTSSSGNQNFGIEDVQMNEAVNIVKDMISLQKP